MDGRGPTGELVAPAEFGPFDALADVAHALYIEGFADRAVRSCREWLCLTELAGDAETSRYLRYIEAVALLELGLYESSLTAARRLVSALGDSGDAVWRVKALSVVAESSVGLGEHGPGIAAMAEADWLVKSVTVGTYGHLSASMAAALALRSVNLLEQAEALLDGIPVGRHPEVDIHVVQQLAMLSLYWGTTLLLMGEEAEAAAHFARAASRAVRMQAVALAAGNPQMVARGQIVEAYSGMHLGCAELAAARAMAAAERFTVRPELLESQLLDLVVGRAAADAGRLGAARDLLRRAVRDAEQTRRELWASTAMAALADVDAREHGSHGGMELWRSIARTALGRVWTERKARFEALHARENLRVLAEHSDRIGKEVLRDPLTGLGNRRMLESAATSAVSPSAAVFVDVDGFKQINDTFSHAVGDEVLRALADILRTASRAEDTLVRYGGDEFVVLPQGGVDAAAALAHRVHREVRDHRWERLAAGMAITVSVGVGGTTGSGSGWLGVADDALLAAKRAGRDRVVISAA